MKMKSRGPGATFLVLLALATTAARAEPVASIRLTDKGPFQVWNGVDGDAPPASGQRVLAVIGATKSLRVNYTASMTPPRVSMGRGWADIVAGPGTAMTFAGPDHDCYSNMILYCTNHPIQGAPPGAIVCMCIYKAGSVCCSSDTGFYSKGMVAIDSQL
jgi:hypothetical protein